GWREYLRQKRWFGYLSRYKYVAEKVKEILLNYAATLFKDLPENLGLTCNKK
ncbi:unnamed protein product, partial [marine sediment metagenome]